MPLELSVPADRDRLDDAEPAQRTGRQRPGLEPGRRQQLGDVFGPPVNLAARLTGVARRNRVITDRRTAGLLPPARFESRPLPARPLRGFGVVEPVAVRRH